MWNGRAIDAAIEDKEWVTGFQENLIAAPPHSILDVEMTENVELDERGNAVGKATYVVTKVYSVTLPPQQTRLEI
jgi:hypothetical protein